MRTLTSEAPRLPTLRSIKDLAQPFDADNIVDLSKLYGMTVNPTSDEQIARQGVWHPSSCGGCELKEVLQFKRVEPTDTHSDGLEQIFEIGHMGHHLVQRRMRLVAEIAQKHGFEYEFDDEVSFDPETDELFLEMGIGGTCDGIVVFRDTDFEQRSLLEIKTISGGDPWKRLIKRNKPIYKHLLQAHIYAYRFDTPIIYLFYVNKSTGKRKVFTILYDAKLLEEALEYFARCNEWIAKDELPPRPEPQDYQECKECSYRSMCKPPVLSRSRATVPTSKLRRK